MGAYITDIRGMGVALSSAWTIEWHLWDCDADNSRVPGEIKRREVELDPQPRRDHEQGGGAGLQKLDFFCFGFLCDSAQARQLKQQLRSALVARQ